MTVQFALSVMRSTMNRPFRTMQLTGASFDRLRMRLRRRRPLSTPPQIRTFAVGLAGSLQRNVMRIVILGGGVVGVTTAYQLQKDGHEVVILERNGLTRGGHELGQRRHDRARPFVRLVVAQGADDPAEIAVPAATRRCASSSRADPAALFLVVAVPDGMHGGEGAPQHAAQAPARRLFAARARRGRRRRGDRLRSQRRAASSISTAASRRSTPASSR